jgi:hypothetical protein
MGSAVPPGQRTESDEQIVSVEEWKESGALAEAREFIKGGRQSVLHDVVEKWYAAGAKNVWFSVMRDFNGKPTPLGLIVELPDDKDARKKCIDALADFWQAVGVKEVDPADLKDPETPFLILDVN